MSCHVMSRLVMSCHVMSSHVISRLLTSCHIMSCHVMSRHDTLESCSRIFLPSLLNSSIMAAGWPRRGFRNRGPARESGSERRSRCGAARLASMPRGRCGGWCDLGIVLRGRLRGSGVPRGMPRVCRGAVPWGLGSGRVLYTHGQRAFRVAGCGDRACWEVCRGCVAGMPGRCAVGIGFGACFVQAWPTCVSRGRLRGSGVSSVCRGHAAGVLAALCRLWGLGSGRVACVACAALCHGDCWRARRVGAAVPWGMLLGVSRGRRWVAPCHGDSCWACRVGGAMPWGLLLGVSRGWLCAMGIAGGRVACVALWHGDWCWACRVGGAVPLGLLGGTVSWGLLTRASSGWRRVFGIADQGVVWAASCLGDC